MGSAGRASGSGKKKSRKNFGKTYRKQKRCGKMLHDDQTFENLTKEVKTAALKNQEEDFDKPGLAQHYCIPCDRYSLMIKKKSLLLR